MSQPTVCAICLVNGRHEMVERAIRCFHSQSYQNKVLLLYDTGVPCYPGETKGFVHAIPGVARDPLSNTIGALRNQAIELAAGSDIIVHWDSDDWSHPERIKEQVDFLIASGKMCVGYEDMLFYEELRGRAWHYLGVKAPCKVPGTTMCYWRRAWELRKFARLPLNPEGTGEDSDWLQAIDSTAREKLKPFVWSGVLELDLKDAPRMVASIHGGNSAGYNDLDQAYSFARVPHLDKFCKEVMSR